MSVAMAGEISRPNKCALRRGRSRPRPVFFSCCCWPSFDSSGPNVRTRNAAKGSRERESACVRRIRTYVSTHTHREILAEVRRGPRAPLSKKLTRPPHGEKIFHPGGGGGLTQKNHHGQRVYVCACARERRGVGRRIGRKRKDEGASSSLDNDPLSSLHLSPFFSSSPAVPSCPSKLPDLSLPRLRAHHLLE